MDFLIHWLDESTQEILSKNVIDKAFVTCWTALSFKHFIWPLFELYC